MKGFIKKLFIGLVFVGFASHSAHALPTFTVGHSNLGNSNTVVALLQQALIKGQINDFCENFAPSNADFDSAACKDSIKACVDEFIILCGVQSTPCDAFQNTAAGITTGTQVALHCNPGFVAPGANPPTVDPGTTTPPPSTDPVITPPSPDTNSNADTGSTNAGMTSGCSLSPLQGAAPMTGTGILSTLMMIPFALRLRKKK